MHPAVPVKEGGAWYSPLMEYTEEREFTLRLSVRCTFPPEYQGEADGYAWWPEFSPIAAEIVHAAAQIVARRPGWTVRPANRGRPSDEEVTLVLERVADLPAGP
jgi:hypothetical protein